jgi:hypothetical protein
LKNIYLFVDEDNNRSAKVGNQLSLLVVDMCEMMKISGPSNGWVHLE